MEQWAYYLCLLLALLLPLLLFKLNGKHSSGNGGLRLPPGPWRLPVIGSLHHLAGNPLMHHVMADLAHRLDAPLMYLKLGEVPVMVATIPRASTSSASSISMERAMVTRAGAEAGGGDGAVLRGRGASRGS